MKRKDLLDFFAWQLSKRKLRRFLESKDIYSVVAATKEYVGRGYYDRISMTQKDLEITQLAKLVKSTNPDVVLEIGTRKGGTLFVWCRYTSASLVISIDLPGGIHGGGYPAKKKKLYKSFVSDDKDRRVELLQMDSHCLKTRNRVVEILDGKKIDFLFIDGDHTLKGVQSDFELYSPLVRRGGVVAFHDIVPNAKDPTIEVPIFWEKIKRSYKHLEIIDKKGEKWMGIGVLFI